MRRGGRSGSRRAGSRSPEAAIVTVAFLSGRQSERQHTQLPLLASRKAIILARSSAEVRPP
jgi:hypothetical protein